MRVEEQVAIIYCGTKGLLKNVPVNKVKLFEKDYLSLLRDNHKDTLDIIKQGQMNDEVTAVLDKAAAEMAARYSEK
jgi:F-type H+-transporting ATPase subunit alpha